jgi:two-component system, chemotaxis family, sensor kinase CheA
VDDLTKEFIAESQEGLERMERCLTDLEKRPDDRELVAEIFRAVHTIKGTTGFLGFGRLESLAHAGEELLGALREGKLAVTADLINGLLDLMDGLRAILQLIETKGSEGLRSTDDDHELIAHLAELKLLGAQKPAGEAPAPQKRGVGQPPVLLLRGEPVAAAAGPSIQDKTLRVEVEALNRMMNLVGELVLTRNQILQSRPDAENFPELARRLDSVTAELRESVMQARMQPVGHLFSKFPRMVRDLARTCGRQVRIEFEGQETGLDKSLLEAIRDPLTHAVRNSVDHGIEPAEARVRAGKAAEGLVRLRAYHQSGSVVIEVIDDGAGISVERVLAKAVERGLVTPEQAEQMSEREALQLIFVAGFSTAQEVTSVSGRGVGMDVVRSNVEKVGGSVELESRAGKGTTLRLRVPLTLAIIPALVVRSGGQSFALPQNSLVELVYVPRRDVATAVERIGSAELYRLRERLLPLVWLDRLLDLERSMDVEAHGIYIAVLESEGCRYGLVVDDLMPPEEIVVKPLSAVLREIGLFSGATVLGNGLLAMILDVAGTAARAGVRPGAELARGAGAEPLAERPQVEMTGAGTAGSLVIVEGRNGERTAMPLSAVERIECVPIEEIEYAGGRPVLQYLGELIPLQDEDDVLGEIRASLRANAGLGTGPAAGPATGAAGNGLATMLICLRPGPRGVQRVGMVVRNVLDVSKGALLAGDPSAGGEQLAMVKDRVTTVHREFAGQATARAPALWKEVA